MPEPRVLRVITRLNLGGPARQCLALHRELTRLGCRELVAFGTCVGEPELGPPRVLSEEAALRARSEATGFVRIRALRRPVDPAADLEALRALDRLVRAFRPAVVHTHTSKAGLLGAWLAKQHRIPLVHSFHGHVLDGHFPTVAARLVAMCERRLARRRSLSICVSGSCRDDLVARGVVRPEAVRVVPPAIPLDEPRPVGASREILGLPERAFVVGFCGRFVPVKDPGLFAQVSAAVRRRRADAIGVAFGAGPLAALLLEHGVHLLGARADFPRLVRALDVLVVTSRREGLPLAAVEALFAGVPVVACDVPGTRDLAGDGVQLVASRDPDRLALRVLDCPPPPTGVAGRLRLRHDPSSIAADFLRCYRELVSCRRGRDEGPRPPRGAAAE